MKKTINILLVLLISIQMGYAESVLSENKKIILITGTASGMGKAFAEQLIKDGHIVYGGDVQHQKNQYLSKIGGFPLKWTLLMIMKYKKE